MEQSKPAISQKDYLKRYLMKDKEKKSKKKKKQAKVSSSTHLKRSVIIDDDINISEIPQVVDNEYTLDHLGDEAPQIVGVVDERPEEVKLAEKYESGKWRPMGADEDKMKASGSTKEASDDDLWGVRASRDKTTRNLRINDSDQSPPRLSHKEASRKGRKEDKKKSSRWGNNSDKGDSDMEVPRSQGRQAESECKHGKNESNKLSRFDNSDESDTSRLLKMKESKDGGGDSKSSSREHRSSSPGRRTKYDRQTESSRRKDKRSLDTTKRNGSTSDSDISLPRRHKGEEDFPPPRRRKGESHSHVLPHNKRESGSDSDLSPPRRRKVGSDSDLSPPRQRKGGKNRDPSPPRRRRQGDKNSDLSPPRRRKGDSDSDLSPPRRRKGGSDSDLSPPRKRKGSGKDRDRSPPRRRKGDKNSDLSPPRRRKGGSDSDLSPPRRRKGGSDSDLSPPRMKKRRDPPDSSPLRSRKTDRIKGQNKTDKMQDGKKAGLQDAKSLKDELRLLKEKEDEMFRQMDPELLGKSTQAVVRDRKTGLKRDFEKEREIERQKAAKNDVRQRKYDKWGKGLKQVQEQEERVANLVHEMSKPLARYADDDDLERALKAQEREGDPMLDYIRQHQKESHSIDLTVGGMRKKYQGSYLPNRFNIPPGHRWDGVDRSNGYEQKWFEAKNSKKATAEEAWKWSSADM